MCSPWAVVLAPQHCRICRDRKKETQRLLRCYVWIVGASSQHSPERSPRKYVVRTTNVLMLVKDPSLFMRCMPLFPSTLTVLCTVCCAEAHVHDWAHATAMGLIYVTTLHLPSCLFEKGQRGHGHGLRALPNLPPTMQLQRSYGPDHGLRAVPSLQSIMQPRRLCG